MHPEAKLLICCICVKSRATAFCNQIMIVPTELHFLLSNCAELLHTDLKISRYTYPSSLILQELVVRLIEVYVALSLANQNLVRSR